MNAATSRRGGQPQRVRAAGGGAGAALKFGGHLSLPSYAAAAAIVQKTCDLRSDSALNPAWS